MAKPKSKDRPQSSAQAEQPLHKSRVQATQRFHHEAGKSFKRYKSREWFPSSPVRQHFPRKYRNSSTKPIYDMKYYPMDEVLSPNALTTAKARCQKHSLFCGSTDLTPLKDCSYDGLGPSGQWRSARTLRFSCPTLTERADVHVKRKLGSATTYFVPNIGSQFNSEQKDLFRLKRVSILDNHSNHSPSPEIGTRHPFKMLNPSDWEGMERFSRRLYLLQQGSPLKGNTQPLSWHQTANVLIMEDFFTEKTFEDFGDVAALMSLYETVYRDVKALFRSIPELAGGRDCVVNLVEDEKAS